MNIDEKIALELGTLMINKNIAETKLENSNETLTLTFALLAETIKSGQIPQEDVPKILEENKGFAEYYKQTK